ncbi:GvpL/GvpF family gas vesicle protein [Fictibacillus sp. NRS-1165]|uniref:GvpL/GvpF family gas vesicle protein n=1 Tax=Fictibacillus sp. NRS-1165 TaxID=3144463 RepID=UPI003D19F458
MSDLIYLYGLIPTEEEKRESVIPFKGLDEQKEAYSVQIGKITAVVCNLDSKEYSEASIEEKINNNMEWLQKKALHHHNALLNLKQKYTVIPMKFCTIYKNENSMRKTIENNQEKITDSFLHLAETEEWNLKIYCDDSLLKKYVSGRNINIASKKEEISKLPPGRQFFEKRKLDQLLDKELETEKESVCEQIHDRLKQFSLNHTVKNNWSKDVTGKKYDMSWNSVYLIAVDRVEEYLEEINSMTKEMEEYGWKFEASGPWPAYHFASMA